MVDYSKWKDIEVSDDEDETHPNIDTPSLFRWRHEARVQKMEEFKQTKEAFEKKKAEVAKKKADAEAKKTKGEDVSALLQKLDLEEKELKVKGEDLEREERLMPWNVDTIGADGFSKTVINRVEKKPEEPLTEEEKMERFRKFSQVNETRVKKFGMLRKYEDSRRFLLDHPDLACEDTANFLVYWCIDLALEEKVELMEHVSHQCICIQFLLELAKQLETDPRACISSFFSKLGHAEQADYKNAFNVELEAFRDRVRRRAEERIAEAEEAERAERLGPGGLDPLEVLESLPEVLQKCFESQDIPMLQRAIKELPEAEAIYHMKRCVDSGLWVPNKGTEEEGGEKVEGAEGGLEPKEETEGAPEA